MLLSQRVCEQLVAAAHVDGHEGIRRRLWASKVETGKSCLKFDGTTVQRQNCSYI